MKPLRLSVLAVALVLAGCTASPTDAPTRDQSAPSFNSSEGNGGNMLGSGTTSTEDGGTPVPTTTPSDSTTTGRGGNGLGSGN